MRIDKNLEISEQLNEKNGENMMSRRCGLKKGIIPHQRESLTYQYWSDNGFPIQMSGMSGIMARARRKLMFTLNSSQKLQKTRQREMKYLCDRKYYIQRRATWQCSAKYKNEVREREHEGRSTARERERETVKREIDPKSRMARLFDHLSIRRSNLRDTKSRVQ